MIVKKEDEKINSVQNKKNQYLRLINPCQTSLYNFIKKSLNYSEEAEDIFQETLIRALRHFNTYNPDKNFKSWLFSISFNLIKTHYRKEKKSTDFIKSIEEIDVYLPENDNVRDIYRIVSEFSLHHREVFFLYYNNEYKINEIVNITGLKKTNVKFILYQSRQKIREILGKKNEKK